MLTPGGRHAVAAPPGAFGPDAARPTGLVMSDWIAGGAQRAVYPFDTRLVLVNADNGKKLPYTLTPIALLLW